MCETKLENFLVKGVKHEKMLTTLVIFHYLKQRFLINFHVNILHDEDDRKFK